MTHTYYSSAERDRLPPHVDAALRWLSIAKRPGTYDNELGGNMIEDALIIVATYLDRGRRAVDDAAAIVAEHQAAQEEQVR